eukprot:TRINITY_DN7632_c0_g1_i3.p2 TRINITY_DN7632_c0_g1~~TRINITY_DN7632_c0_g1_i3.p2  ORF type:complete len:184 (-),score=16.46 TRINITY_DN7632_c0_g1_i3:313-864(-)
MKLTERRSQTPTNRWKVLKSFAEKARISRNPSLTRVHFCFPVLLRSALCPIPHFCRFISFLLLRCIANQCTEDEDCLRDWACGSKCDQTHHVCQFLSPNCSQTSTPYCGVRNSCVTCTSKEHCGKYSDCYFNTCMPSFYRSKWIVLGTLTVFLLFGFLITCAVKWFKYSSNEKSNRTIKFGDF